MGAEREVGMPPGGQPWLHDLVTLVCAPTVALSEASGQIRHGGAQGVLHAGSRVLSGAVLELAGAEPTPVSSGLLAAGSALFVSIPRPLAGDGADPAWWLERERRVSPGRVRERVRVSGAPGARAGTAVVVLRVAADLAVLADIKAGHAVPLAPIAVAGQGLAWGDDRIRVRLSAPGARVSAGPGGEAVLSWRLDLAGGTEPEFGWELTISDTTATVTAPPGATGWARVPRARSGDGETPRARAPAGAEPSAGWSAVRARCADPALPRLIEQSLADAAALRMAAARAPGDTFLAAGAPWYLTMFGRDSIWAARLLLPFGWELAAGTLRALAAFQGTRSDRLTGEAPGKIPHELSPTGRRPVSPGALPALYYGTIDATPLWVCLLHDAWRWGMPAAAVRPLLPAMTAALAWLRDFGDADGDGLLEYRDESGRGLANQGWKDSADAIRFADGRVASVPVALCEVQGYAYQAATCGADLLAAFGEPGATGWRAWAARLAAAFRSSFWVMDAAGPYPALALDADKHQVDGLASNIGHLLGTGLLSAAEEDLVAARLAGTDLDSGFGLRTLSAANGGFSPLSYHCGSVWSHDTAIAVAGLMRSGHRAAAVSLARGLLDAARAFGWRLPELFAGHARAAVPWPSPYPAACRPQAWALASAGALTLAMLGLEVDVPAGTVRIAPPAGPAGGALPGLHIDGLRAGHESFSAGIDAAGAGYVTGLTLAGTAAEPG